MRLFHPFSCVLREDVDFSMDDNLTLLIDMGYVVYIKVYKGQIMSKLCRQLPEMVIGQHVDRNAKLVCLQQQRIAECPFDLKALVVCYYILTSYFPITLLYNGDRPPPLVLRDWFSGYNSSLIVKSGIKESKVVLRLHYPLVRLCFGMLMQKQFSLFAANSVRRAV